VGYKCIKNWYDHVITLIILLWITNLSFAPLKGSLVRLFQTLVSLPKVCRCNQYHEHDYVCFCKRLDEFCEVCFDYSWRTNIIFENLSFLVSAGKIIAVVGPGGSKKSTIISSIQPLFKYDD